MQGARSVSRLAITNEPTVGRGKPKSVCLSVSLQEEVKEAPAEVAAPPPPAQAPTKAAKANKSAKPAKPSPGPTEVCAPPNHYLFRRNAHHTEMFI